MNSGDGAVNFQVAGDLTVTGVTSAEARDIARDVARAEFAQLSGRAHDEALRRADDLVDELIGRINERTDELVLVTADPDFQWMLAQAKIAYARSGDQDQRDVLVDLLVERVRHQDRTLRQIAVAESAAVVGKLTSADIAALGLVFAVRHTYIQGLSTPTFDAIMRQRFGVFAGELPADDVSYQHLQFAGCGVVGVGSRDIVDQLSDLYFGRFVDGLTIGEIETLRSDVGADVVAQAFEEPDTSGIARPRWFDAEAFTASLKAQGIPDHSIKRMRTLLVGRIDREAARRSLDAIDPAVAAVIQHWTEGMAKHFTLSSVGIAIGHAEVRRRTGDQSDLSIWIPN